jgi:mannose-6-phosphate isomerase-like protein (cupin superfamily)
MTQPPPGPAVPEPGEIYVGTAAADAPASRGWLLGHFRPDGDPRHSDDVEIKWGIHPAGHERGQWVTDDHRTAAILLISGRFRVELPGRSVLLQEQGDYLVFRGTPHTWRAETESLVVTVRWPSVPGFATPAG